MAGNGMLCAKPAAHQRVASRETGFPPDRGSVCEKMRCFSFQTVRFHRPTTFFLMSHRAGLGCKPNSLWSRRAEILRETNAARVVTVLIDTVSQNELWQQRNSGRKGTQILLKR